MMCVCVCGGNSEGDRHVPSDSVSLSTNLINELAKGMTVFFINN